MTATADMVAGAETSVPVGVIVELPASHEQLTAAAAVQNAAYGAPAPTVHDVRRLVDLHAAGGSVALARTATGEPVGSGLVTAPHDAVAELAAVGVLDPWRRRGIAGALTSALVDAAFAGPATTVMLMGDQAEQRIYARAGFRPASEVVFLSRSETA